MKRYSKKVREEAALICAIAASGGAFVGHWSPAYSLIADEIEHGIGRTTGSLSLHLAVLAWMKARHESFTWTREMDAEAEALIRCGFPFDGDG